MPKKQTKQNKGYVQYQNQCIHYGNFFHYSVCVFLILFQHKHLTLQTLKRLTKKFHFPLNHLKIKLFQTLSFNGITTLHWKLESFSWSTDIRLPSSLQEVVEQTSLNNLGKFSCGVGCKILSYCNRIGTNPQPAMMLQLKASSESMINEMSCQQVNIQ